MKSVKLPIIACTLLLAAASGQIRGAAKPKLVVQIVVSQMRYDYLERFRDNFSDNGFRAYTDNGTTFANARHDYMQTHTVAGLATIATGTNPSGHGIVSESWYNYTNSDSVNLIYDSAVRGLDCEAGEQCYSGANLTVATLGDRLRQSDPRSKAVALATDPYSAIVCGGASADVFWMDREHGNWISSSYYFDKLPRWVTQYNETQFPQSQLDREWTAEKPFAAYVNTDSTVLGFQPDRTPFVRNFFSSIVKIFKKTEDKYDLETLHYMPAGNTIVTNFAKEAILGDSLGKDEHTDLLTICYDTPRLIGQLFGPRSIEVEDMYYKLDLELAELNTFLSVLFAPEEVVVVLTSDHGCSDTYREGSRTPSGRFNTEQFKIIMNGFLSAQYEPGNWVLGYRDRQLFLNREMIYKYGFNLAEVQTRAAAFALQFRGVSAALTSTDMQSGSFARGYGEKMQNGFYPKRSGDLTINLMPGWIEERTGVVSMSGSLYEYDTHVPLVFYGGGIPAAEVERNVSMTSVAPTLARIMRIAVPDAATGEALEEIANDTEK